MNYITKNYQAVKNTENIYKSFVHNIKITDTIKYEVIVHKSEFLRIGICSSKCKKYFPVGYTETSFAYTSNGYKINSGYKTTYGENYGANDIIGVEVNVRSGYIRFYKNGIDMEVAYWNIPNIDYYPVISCYGVCEVEINYGKYQAYTKNTLDDLLCNIE
ncbi:hypothetical protein BDAP_002414 [Binucleata daphniae]